MGKTQVGGAHLHRDVYAGQVIGARKSQQDAYADPLVFSLAGREAELYLVSDGMGGHAGGELASQLVVVAFQETFSSGGENLSDLFHVALDNANQKVAAEGERDPELEGMGATAVAVVVMDNELYLCSVGDSPLWLIRQGQMSRLNEDHSMLPVLLKMAEMEEISIEDAHNDPKRHVLRSVIHGKDIKLKNIPNEPLVLEQGDAIVLGSDGIESLTEEHLIQLLGNTARNGAKTAVNNVLKAIEKQANPTQDNATLIVAHFGKGQNTIQPKKQTQEKSINKSFFAGLSVGIMGLIIVLAYFLLGSSDPSDIETSPLTGGGESVEAESSSEAINDSVPRQKPSVVEKPPTEIYSETPPVERSPLNNSQPEVETSSAVSIDNEVETRDMSEGDKDESVSREVNATPKPPQPTTAIKVDDGESSQIEEELVKTVKESKPVKQTP